MRIGIDARLINETGVGRYIRNLIADLAKIDKSDEFVIFLKSNAFDKFDLPGNNFRKIRADIPWHSFKEQFKMPGIFQSANLDLVHIPYFNIPIFYRGKTVVTIHDLTILHFATGRATTLPKWLYLIRRIGYWIVLSIGLNKASKIIAVSEATKKEIIHHFGIPENKIQISYEGVDDKLTTLNNLKNERLIKSKYFLYVGNAYPHKNLELLINAFNDLKSETKLVFVGKEDLFYKRLKEIIHAINLDTKIIFIGEANDAQLNNLYKHAEALIFPSVMEGFGLPAIEALSLGCPVIASDIPVFHEILGKFPIYFNPNSTVDLTNKIKEIDDHPQTKKIIFDLTKYNWAKMAKITLDIYKQI